MNYFFHPEAEQEFYETVFYYESTHKGLGSEFAHEVHTSIMRILQFPDAYPSFSDNTRRCILNRFPYGILYSVNKARTEIFILAIMNLHRKPDYWDERT